MRPWKWLIEVETATLCHWLNLLIVGSVFYIVWRDLTNDFIISASGNRCHTFKNDWRSFFLLFSFKHRPSRLMVLASILVKALGSHMKILDFEVLDPIAKNSILLSQMYKFSIYVINSDSIVRSYLFLAALFEITELAVLSIWIDDLTFYFTGKQIV